MFTSCVHAPAILLAFFVVSISAQVFNRTGWHDWPQVSGDRNGFLDFEGDGDSDFWLFGRERSGPTLLEMYENRNGNYVQLSHSIPVADVLDIAWGDLDGDSDLDIAVAVRVQTPDTVAWEIHFHLFDPVLGTWQRDVNRAPLEYLRYGIFELVDIDKDGYAELLVSGMRRGEDRNGMSARLAFYRNDGKGTMIPIESGLPAVWAGGTAWADIDNDGDLDVAYAGNRAPYGSTAGPVLDSIFHVYTNHEGIFSLHATLSGLATPDIRWMNKDADPYLDLLAVGHKAAKDTALYYTGGPSGYTLETHRIYALEPGALDTCDFNADGKTDFVTTGQLAPGVNITLLYENFLWLFIVTSHADYMQATRAGRIHCRDLNGDRKPDILMSGLGSDGSYQWIYYENGGAPYVEQTADLGGIYLSSPQWGDVDGDGDMDLLYVGARNATGRVNEIVLNDGGFTSPRRIDLPESAIDAQWGDFDRDGDLDILLRNDAGSPIPFHIARNDGNLVFELLPLPTLAADIATFSWKDTDGDGDLDILATRSRYSGKDGHPYHYVYDNGYSLVATDFPEFFSGRFFWQDYDLDGDQDLLVGGEIGLSESYLGLFEREGSSFKDRSDRIDLSAYRVSTAAWSDVDGDGLPDLITTGFQHNESRTRHYLFRQGPDRFTRDPGTELKDLDGNSAAFGDFDMDGDWDYIVAGDALFQGGKRDDYFYLYRRDSLDFGAHFPTPDILAFPHAALADFDGDGDLDILLSGRRLDDKGQTVDAVRLYRNDIPFPNERPIAPSGLMHALGKSEALLSWGPGSDSKTAQNALVYNVRVGTFPGGMDVVSPHSLPDGRRLLPDRGNTGHARKFRLTGLKKGTYYWSVQTIDGSLVGSAFAGEGSFTIGLDAPTWTEAIGGNASVRLSWNHQPAPHFAAYRLVGGLDTATATELGRYAQAADTSIVLTGLTNDTIYHFRVESMDRGGNSSVSSWISRRTDGTPPAMPEAFHVFAGDRSVHLGWKPNTEPDFLMYRIYQKVQGGALALFDSITDIRVSSHTVGSLSNGSPYSFFLSAVDSVGNQSAITEEKWVSPSFQLISLDSTIEFGRLGLHEGRQLHWRLRNEGDLPVTIDSITFDDPSFIVVDAISSVPARSELTIPIRFGNHRPAGGDFQARVRAFYGSSFLEARLRASAVAPPWARITSIEPASVAWDTSGNIQFLSSANDSDDAGQGNRLTGYSWGLEKWDPIAKTWMPVVADLPSEPGWFRSIAGFPIGRLRVSLRVKDNEGDSSQVVHREFEVRSRPPVIASLSSDPAGLLLHGGKNLTLSAVAFDRDEGAHDGADSLHSFTWHSAESGPLGRGKRISLASTTLNLGLNRIFAVAVDNEGDTTISDTLKLSVQVGRGHAVLVAGTAFNDLFYFYQNIAANSNWAYRALLRREYAHEQIHYLNPISWQSIGEPYVNSGIVDEDRVTLKNLKARIGALAEDYRRGIPLLIHLMGHGDDTRQKGKFFLNPDESLSPDTLDAWLDALGTPVKASAPILLVLDFCYSGTFLAGLAGGDQPRIVITSSSPDRPAYTDKGFSFSSELFRHIAAGHPLDKAYAAARNWSNSRTQSEALAAVPRVNADGDFLYEEIDEDLGALTQFYVGGTLALQTLESYWERLELSITNGKLRIEAKPNARRALEQAWYTLIHSDFRPDESDPGLLPGSIIPFSDSSYIAEIDMFTLPSGSYLVTVHGLARGEQIFPISQSFENHVARPLGLIGLTEGRFGLGFNHPNPFSGYTVIPFMLTRPGRANLRILDSRGVKVWEKQHDFLGSGLHRIVWDGSDALSRPLPKGMYIYRIEASEGSEQRKLIKQE